MAVGLSTFLTLLFCLVAPLAAQTAETTLEYWIWDNNQLPAVEQIVEAFEARYPNINVNVSVVPWGDYWERTLVALMAGSGPDVFWMTMYDLISWIERGLIDDITARIESDPGDAPGLRHHRCHLQPQLRG